MGTRADFYIGKGKDARWLGSIGQDGYPENVAKELSVDLGRSIASENDWVESVNMVFSAHPEYTLPEKGWPWPWKDSNTTDYAYTYDENAVWVSCFGTRWVSLRWALEDEDSWDKMEGTQLEFPDMTSIQKIRYDAGNAPMIIGRRMDGSMGLVNDEVAAQAEAQDIVDEAPR